MDLVFENLNILAIEFSIKKKQFYESLETALKAFPISDDEKKSITFGVIKPSNEDLQIFADKINSNPILIRQNTQFRRIRFNGITSILQYAISFGIEVPGYSLKKLLADPYNNRVEIDCCFYSLCGVEQLHLIDGKIMMEMPVRYYLRNKRKLLKYADYWFSCTW